MIHAQQHLPAWLDTGEPPQKVSVPSVPDLFLVPWIQSWEKVHPFQRWSLSKCSDKWCLMAEMDGKESWVIAILDPDPALEMLPDWTPNHP